MSFRTEVRVPTTSGRHDNDTVVEHCAMSCSKMVFSRDTSSWVTTLLGINTHVSLQNQVYENQTWVSRLCSSVCYNEIVSHECFPSQALSVYAWGDKWGPQLFPVRIWVSRNGKGLSCETNGQVWLVLRSQAPTTVWHHKTSIWLLWSPAPNGVVKATKGKSYQSGSNTLGFGMRLHICLACCLPSLNSGAGTSPPPLHHPNFPEDRLRTVAERPTTFATRFFPPSNTQLLICSRSSLFHHPSILQVK